VKALDDLFAARHIAARGVLFVRGLYLLLAIDVWFAMVEHGARYGVGGFNVSHFAWLDALLPLPTATLYVGLLVTAGMLSLFLALGSAPRPLRLVLCGLYTVAWMISLHDSYQHHYLISWLLLWCAGYDELDPNGAAAQRGELVSGWGFAMTATTCAIVYTFTGISKCEYEWRTGHVLRILTHSTAPSSPRPGKFDALRDALLNVGLSDAQVWQLFALSTIALQWTIALAYLAAIRRDERPSRVRTLLVWSGLLGSYAFHAAAEIFELFEIGLFSFYMMWIATLMLAPGPLVTRLLTPFAWVDRRVDELVERSLAVRGVARRSRGLPIAALLLLAAIGLAIPLPGATRASLLAAATIAMALSARWQERDERVSLRLTLRLLATAAAALLALRISDVPFDYYRRSAGELRRMGRLEQALEQYRNAERYAPPGLSRAKVIRELEAELSAKTKTR
jgi:hypothetical protein